MKQYYIYDMQSGEYLGSVIANSIENAELKYICEHNVGSYDIYALTTAPGEPWA